jgi:hypothetical protein
MFHSFAYGLHLRANLPITGLLPTEPPASVDVDIHLGATLRDDDDPADYEQRYASPYLGSAGTPIVTISVHPVTGYYRWNYSQGMVFLVDPRGTTVQCAWPAGHDVDDAALSLLGPILGFVLRLRGTTCLHASAVAVDGRAVVLLGRPFVGKSTTAAALTLLGYPLVSEDVVPLLNRGTHYDVVPGYPVIRLWPSAAEFLYGSAASLPLLTQSRDKRRLDVIDRGHTFHSEPLPLGAIYYLSRRTDDDAAPFIEPTLGPNALAMLVGETYTNYALSKEMRASEFVLLGELTRTVPMRRVTAHKDQSRLPRLCETILNDFAAVTRDRQPVDSR